MASHDEHFDDIPAYVLGALPGDDAESLERHLESCPICREELRRQRPIQSALAGGVPPVTPPPSLKEAVMSQVRAEARQAAPRRRFSPGLRPARLVAVAAACLLALAVGFGVARLTENDSSRVVQASVDRAHLPGASAQLVVQSGQKTAILRVSGMPELPPDRTYQAWVQHGAKVSPATIFAVGRGGRGSAAISTDVGDADAVLVTREPRGGSSKPSEQPVIRAPL